MQEHVGHSPALFIFVLDSVAATEHWLTHVADVWPPERTILLVDWPATETEAVSPLLKRSAREFMLLVLGNKHGIAEQCPYDGFAPAVIDAIAAKVGTALISSTRMGVPGAGVPASPGDRGPGDAAPFTSALSSHSPSPVLSPPATPTSA
jgi:hypothetical protein